MVLVALVLRSQFQEVVARSNGRKVGLFQLTLLEKPEGQADVDDGLLVFKIWGNTGKDRLRHRIGRGSIVAIEETKRRVDWRNNANEGTIIEGDLIAFSEINSDEMCVYEPNPTVHMDYMVRSKIAESAKELLHALTRSERWALLRSCACRAYNKSSLHAILSDSKALLFNVDLVVPLESFLSFDDFKVRDSDGVSSKMSFKDSMARESFVAQVASALRPFPLLQTFVDQLKDVLVTDGERPPQKASDTLQALESCLSDILKRDLRLLDRVITKNEGIISESSPLRSDYSLKFHFQKIAVLSSYNRRITALQFLSHETSLSMTSDAIAAHTHCLEQHSAGIRYNIATSEHGITREVPDIKFISWKNMLPLLTTLPLDNVGVGDVDKENDHRSFPQEYFLFCGYVHDVEFFGNEPDTFYNNIQYQQPLVGSMDDLGGGGDWSFRDATISISASPSTLPNVGRQTIDSIEEIEQRLCRLMHDRCFLTGTGQQLQTQCPFSYQSLPSSLLESTRSVGASGDDLFHASTFRAKDLIFALAEAHRELSNPVQSSSKGGDHTIVTENPPPMCQLTVTQESYRPISTLHLLSAPSQYPTYPELAPILGHTNETSTACAKKRKIRDEEMPVAKKRLCSQNSVHWRYTIPSTFTADQIFSAPTADAWNNEQKLTLLMTHDFQQKRLFQGISPLVLALDLYHQAEYPDASHSITNLAPVKKCVEEIQRLRVLSTTSNCLLFVARLLPSVDDDGGFTGDMLLSLEDIL